MFTWNDNLRTLGNLLTMIAHQWRPTSKSPWQQASALLRNLLEKFWISTSSSTASLAADTDLWPLPGGSFSEIWSITKNPVVSQQFTVSVSGACCYLNLQDCTIRLWKWGGGGVVLGSFLWGWAWVREGCWWWGGRGGSWGCILIPQTWLLHGPRINWHVGFGHLKMLLGL